MCIKDYYYFWKKNNFYYGEIDGDNIIIYYKNNYSEAAINDKFSNINNVFKTNFIDIKTLRKEKLKKIKNEYTTYE